MAAASCKENREPGGLLVRQGSKLHAKMLSKEAAAPSFRVYYSVASAGAVPFLWESQPGTPKDDDSPSAAAAALAPPLTPPPSYYAAAGEKGARSRKRRQGIGFPRFAFLRTWSSGRTLPSYSASSSSSSNWSTSSSSSSTMSPVFTVQSSSPAAAAASRGHHHRRTFSAGEEDDDEARCFGMERECCDRGIAKGCSVIGAVRTALATVVGGKPARRRA